MSRAEHSKGRRRRQGGSLCAVTFDVTSTLIHAPRLAEIYGEILGRHGVPVEAVELKRLIRLVWKEFSCHGDMRRDRFARFEGGAKEWWHRFVARLCEHLDTPPPTRFASAELYARFARADAWEVYGDVRPALESLRQAGLRLGVVSNWDERLPGLLSRLGFDGFFDIVVSSSAVGVEKPHPKIFLYALRALGVEPSEALHVGDSPIEDVEGAMAAGMRAVLLDRRP